MLLLFSDMQISGSVFYSLAIFTQHNIFLHKQNNKNTKTSPLLRTMSVLHHDEMEYAWATEQPKRALGTAAAARRLFK